jgi:hypothetical protein
MNQLRIIDRKEHDVLKGWLNGEPEAIAISIILST